MPNQQIVPHTGLCLSEAAIRSGRDRGYRVVPVFRPVCRSAKLQLWFRIMRRSLGSGVEYHWPLPASAAYAMSAGVFRCKS